MIGVISVLDAATNDLTQLYESFGFGGYTRNSSRPLAYTVISFYGGEAGNGSHAWRKSRQEESYRFGQPRDKQSAENEYCLDSSLRPYPQTRKNSQPIPESTPMTTSAILGQQIAPWPQLDWANSPPRFALKPAPEIEPPLVFQPLRPAKKAGFLAPIKTVSPSASLVTTPRARHDTSRSHSSRLSGHIPLGGSRSALARITGRR